MIYHELHKTSGDGQYLGVVSAFRVRLLFHNGSQDSWNRHKDTISEWSASIVDQHDVVGVKLGHLHGLLLFQPDENSLLFLALDCHHHSVANSSNPRLVVNVDCLRGFAFHHCPLADLTVVDHSQPGQQTNLVQRRRCVKKAATQSGEVPDARQDCWLEHR